MERGSVKVTGEVPHLSELDLLSVPAQPSKLKVSLHLFSQSSHNKASFFDTDYPPAHFGGSAEELYYVQGRRLSRGRGIFYDVLMKDEEVIYYLYQSFILSGIFFFCLT